MIQIAKLKQLNKKPIRDMEFATNTFFQTAEFGLISLEALSEASPAKI